MYYLSLNVASILSTQYSHVRFIVNTAVIVLLPIFVISFNTRELRMNDIQATYHYSIIISLAQLMQSNNHPAQHPINEKF